MALNVKIKAMSSLEKLYNGDNIPDKEYSAVSMLKGERKSFQIALECDDDFSCEISVFSEIKNINIYKVVMVHSDFPMQKKDCDDYFRYSADGYYPDLLMPVGVNSAIDFKKGLNVLWVEIDSGEMPAGNYGVTVNFQSAGFSYEARISAEIIDCKPDFDGFIYTSWFYTDCLMSYYNFKAFSDEYWRVTENFLKTAAEHGMNCVLTPVFTPPLDTQKGGERPTVQLVEISYDGKKYAFNFEKLDKWINLAQSCGIEYFEISHFYTQWGAAHAPKIIADVNGELKQIFGWNTRASSKEYKDFLTAFSVEFKKFVSDRKLRDKIILHVSDEPFFTAIYTYAKASKTIHRLFPEYKIIDALSDYTFYKLKIVTQPVPSSDHIEKFIGKTDELWTYYCSSQHKKYVSNRFFCNSSLRNRVLGCQLYKYAVKGFLHWGYNFYYTQYSKALIDPFKVTDAGGKFPSGDSFVVYPAKDGTAYCSLRLKVFYDALQDMAAFKALEKLTDKEYVMNIIEENGKYNLTFSNYPHSDDWLLRVREKVNQAIKEKCRGEQI